MQEDSRQIIFNLTINLLMGVGKLAAGILGRSGAVTAEGIHSFVDAINTSLLLWGVKSSQRSADLDHPFGYGKEVYFWSLIVALVIFVVGVGFSIGEGILSLQRSADHGGLGFQYAVLGGSILFEGWAFLSARQRLSKEKGGRSTWRFVHETKNPTMITFFFEGGTAFFGVLVALAGITLREWLHSSLPDAIASFLIGFLLAGGAAILIYESRGLLLGEGFPADQAKKLQDFVREDPNVINVQYPITMYLSPEEVLLNLDIEFVDHLGSDDVEKVVARLEERIKQQWPEIKRIYLEAKSLAHHPADLNRPE